MEGKYVGEAEATMADFNKRAKQIVKNKKRQEQLWKLAGRIEDK